MSEFTERLEKDAAELKNGLVSESIFSELRDCKKQLTAKDARIIELEQLAVRERCLFLHARDNYPPIDISAYENKAKEILNEQID